VHSVQDDTRDVYDPANPAHASLVAALEEYLDRMTAAFTGDETLAPEDRDELLRSLGYIE
jgi:hypothetical protein